VLHTTYGALDGPLLAHVDLLVSRHLAAIRPEDIVATFANGKKRTYRRVIEPRKEDVGPRHARRRHAQAKEEVARIFRVDPGFASAVMDDVCRLARASGGVALAPTAAVSALPQRLQAQFMVDNNVSKATFQRFRRLLGPRECGLATAQQLRAELRSASEEENNKATTNGDGVYLISPRAAVEVLIFYLRRKNQFIERGLRGADVRAVAATLPFVGQTSASALHSSAVQDVHICFGLDKGGLISSCKAVLSCAIQLNPTSRGHSILYGVFLCKKDDREALARMADVYVPDLDTPRTGGVDVGGHQRAVRLILIGDYSFMTTWVGQKGASSRMPCLWCTVLRRRTHGNGLLVDQWGDMQDGSRARGVSRCREHSQQMAAAFAAGDNARRATPMPLEEHFSIERRSLLIIEPSHISPMPLHLTLGVTGAILRLGIEAVYFHHGPARASAYAMNLTLALRFAVGATPKPYFGGAFEGRQCQLIARRLSAVIDLFETHAPAADAAAYRAACDT